MRNKLFIISILILTSISTIFAENVKIGDLCYIPNAAEKTVEVISCDKPSKETRLIAYTSSNSSNTSSINSMTFDENIHQYRVSVGEGYRLQPGDTIIIAKEMVRYLTGEESSEWVYYVRHVIAQVGGKRYPDGILVAGINSWIAYENAYLAGAVNKTAEALAQEKADQFQVETREAELVQKNEAELEEIRKKAESVGLEVLGSSTTDEYSPERSISDSKTATTPSTSAPTQQTAAATQNTAIATAKQIGRPLCTILSPKDSDQYSTPTIKLRYEITNAPSEKYSVQFFVAGFRASPITQAQKKGAHVVNGTEVELRMPQNKLTAVSVRIVDANGFPISEDATITLEYKNQRKPTLHVFAVGVNKYKVEDFDDLKYAENDARDFVNAIVDLADNEMYERVDTTIILGSRASRNYILAQLMKLEGRVKSNDIVMLFFSGHGMVENDKSYFITSDAEYVIQGLATRDIVDQIELMKKRSNVFVFMDACHSGAMKTTERTKGNAKPITLAESEVIGYYSCAEKEKSIEDDNLKNGVFTYALINSLKGKVANEGQITIRELDEDVRKWVQEKTKGKQTPTLDYRGSDYVLFYKK